MTINLDFAAAMAGAVVGAIVANALGYSTGIPVYIAMGAFGMVSLAVWMYSPLPSTNGGVASTDPLRGRYWGFYPGGRWRPPESVAAHETEPRAIYDYGDEYLAIDIERGVKAWGESGEEADKQLESLVSADG